MPERTLESPRAEQGSRRSPLDRAALELAELADEVLQEVTELRRRCEELARVLDAVEELGARQRGSEEGGDSEARAGGSRRGAVDSIVQTAALAGASRAEVEAYLSEELHLPEVQSAVEKVYGEARPQAGDGGE